MMHSRLFTTTHWLIIFVALLVLRCAARTHTRARTPRERLTDDACALLQVGWHAKSNSAVAEVQTPRLDALAADGIVLGRAYAFKYCSPTRCAIQSGRNPIHVNVDNSIFGACIDSPAVLTLGCVWCVFMLIKHQQNRTRELRLPRW